MNHAVCPALLISAPASGQGKTLVTAALARVHARAGRRVRVFKCGPDFLDPMVLEKACGASVYNLDLFMGGEDDCRQRLYEAACEADLILVEGVMGLFDGAPSAADLAALFGLPVLGVIDGSAMAGSFGALAYGLATWRDDISVVGVLANRVGGERHAAMLEASLRPPLRWLGALPRDGDIVLPERHLGLVQACELDTLATRLDRAADLLGASALWLPPSVIFTAPNHEPVPRLLQGLCIAVAHDAAFSFLYPANLALLDQMGARIAFFSPLSSDRLPPCDAVWLPGGYPELHGERLAANQALIADLHTHVGANKPLLAECGGMLFCLERLVDGNGQSFAMAGLIPGHAMMQRRLAALGLQEITLPEGRLRGHSFHYATIETSLTPARYASNPNGGAREALFRHGSLTASFMHFYFPSCPQAVAGIFGGLGRS